MCLFPVSLLSSYHKCIKKMEIQLHSFLTSDCTRMNSQLHKHSPSHRGNRTPHSTLKIIWISSNSRSKLLNINTFTCNARTKIFGGPVYTLVTTIKESVFRCGNSVSSEEEDSKTLKIHSKEEKVLTKKT